MTSTSTTRRTRQPVVYASRSALDDAARLAPGAVLETLVAEAIVAGNVRRDRRHGPRGFAVTLAAGVVASVVRTRSPLGTRRAWHVVRLEETRR